MTTGLISIFRTPKAAIEIFVCSRGLSAEKTEVVSRPKLKIGLIEPLVNNNQKEILDNQKDQQQGFSFFDKKKGETVRIVVVPYHGGFCVWSKGQKEKYWRPYFGNRW
ncbi:hypothetical protein ACFL0A_01435 [Patescibacteria group bacterium]